MYVTKLNILGNACRILSEVLEYNSKGPIKLCGIILLYIPAIKQNSSLGRVVKSCKKLDKRRLTRSVKSYKHNRFTRPEFKIDVFKHHSLALGVCKGYVLKFYRMRLTVSDPCRLCYARNNGLLFLDEGNKIIYKERTLVNLRRMSDKTSHRSRNRGKRTRIKSIFTYSEVATDNLCGNKYVKQAGYCRMNYCKSNMPCILVNDKPTKSLVINFKCIGIALDKGFGKIEHSYFLYHILIYHKVGIIAHLSSFLRATPHITNGFASVNEVNYRIGN